MDEAICCVYITSSNEFILSTLHFTCIFCSLLPHLYFPICSHFLLLWRWWYYTLFYSLITTWVCVEWVCVLHGDIMPGSLYAARSISLLQTAFSGWHAGSWAYSYSYSYVFVFLLTTKCTHYSLLDFMSYLVFDFGIVGVLVWYCV